MTIKLFDTHGHVNADQFVGKEAEVIQHALEMDVHYIGVVGFDAVTNERSLKLSSQYPNLISILGWHPTEAYSYTAEVERKLEEQLDSPNVYMVGEIGLDYHWDTSTPAEQDYAFRRQIAIAKNMNLPIAIHERDAHDEVVKVLRQEGVPERGGIMHNFGGNPDQARELIDLGMHLSFSGVLTFKKSDEVRQACKIIPKERLLLETDAPYLTPEPYRGKTNYPGYVRYTAERMAEVREVSLEEIAKQTSQNAFELFGWWPEDE